MKLEDALQPSKVWCVTLEAMPQKWVAARQRIGGEFPSVEPFAATDRRDASLESLPVDVPTRYRRRNGRKRKHHHEFSAPGAIGCFESHVKAWRRLLETPGAKFAMIFEDDAVENFGAGEFRRHEFEQLAPKLSSARDWDVLLVGVIHRYPTDPSPVSGTQRVVHPFFGMHAYAVSRRGAEYMLSKLQYPLTAQLDAWIGMLANLHRDEFVVLSLQAGSLYSTLQSNRSTTQSSVYDCQLCDHEETCSASDREARSMTQKTILATAMAFIIGVVLAALYVCLSNPTKRRQPDYESSFQRSLKTLDRR